MRNTLRSLKQLSKNIQDIHVVRRSMNAISERIEKYCLVVGTTSLGHIFLQSPILMAMRNNGVGCCVVWEKRSKYSLMVSLVYRYCFSAKVVYLSDFASEIEGDSTKWGIGNSLDKIKSLETYGVRVGLLSLSTFIRQRKTTRVSCEDIYSEDFRSVYRNVSSTSSKLDSVFKRLDIRYVLVSDICYSPEGVIMDLALFYGAVPIVFNLGHKPNSFCLKKITYSSREQHPLSVSKKMLDETELSPSEIIWNRVRDELYDMYMKGAWYKEVGTSDFSQVDGNPRFREELGIAQSRKVAVVFPHILWDATGIYGKDLFDDYETWLREVLAVAIRNRGLDWIIKIHPANVYKMEGENEVSAEEMILRTYSPLPPHIKVLPSRTSFSTFDILGEADYCLTVRGTVGIEAAIRGVTVLTAGSGRYEGLGFTEDFKDKTSYLDTLARLQRVPGMTVDAVSRARLYAYCLFIRKTVMYSSLSYDFERGARKKLRVKINIGSEKRMVPDDWMSISEWLDKDECDYSDKDTV